MTWVDNETIEAALKKKSEKALKESGIKYCISNKYIYCIFIRELSALHI